MDLLEQSLNNNIVLYGGGCGASKVEIDDPQNKNKNRIAGISGEKEDEEQMEDDSDVCNPFKNEVYYNDKKPQQS